MENARFIQGLEQLKAIDGRRAGTDYPFQPAHRRRVRAAVGGTH